MEGRLSTPVGPEALAPAPAVLQVPALPVAVAAAPAVAVPLLVLELGTAPLLAGRVQLRGCSTFCFSATERQQAQGVGRGKKVGSCSARMSPQLVLESVPCNLQAQAEGALKYANHAAHIHGNTHAQTFTNKCLQKTL